MLHRRPICVFICVLALATACERKTSKSQPNPPQRSETPQDTSGGANNGTAQGNGNKEHQGAPSKEHVSQGQSSGKEGTAAPARQAQNSLPSAERSGATTPPLATPIPKPADSSPALPVQEKEVAKLDRALPEVSPQDTFGGILVSSYLKGAMTGEQVISQVFDNNDLVMSNLAEMSVAVRDLRARNAYSPQDQEKILVLEGAMTQYLNEKLANDRELATALEYGTAAALGLAGGIYSNEIISALQRMANAPAVQNGLRNIYSIYESAKGSPAAISQWLGQRLSRTKAPEVAEATVQKSSELYRRTVGYVNAPADHSSRERTVFNYIYRVINSPDLVKGYRVTTVPATQLDEVSQLRYFSTGIPGFRLNQVEGRDYLIAQLVSRGGAFEYYRITGLGIKAVTHNGEEMVVPPQAMAGLISARMRDWGRKTANILRSTGREGRDAVKNSRPYQYVSSDPFARRVAQGAAVGVPISALTLLALKPLDTSYLTIDDYLRDLERDGITVDQFIDVQKAKSVSRR